MAQLVDSGYCVCLFDRTAGDVSIGEGSHCYYERVKVGDSQEYCRVYIAGEADGRYITMSVDGFKEAFMPLPEVGEATPAKTPDGFITLTVPDETARRVVLNDGGEKEE